MSYLPIPTQSTCTRAWLAATEVVNRLPQREAHNVIIDVDQPAFPSDADRSAITVLDSFLRKHDHYPVKAVAKTIFPQWTYDLHGSPAFYDVYLKTVFPRLKRSSADWGRYFERMISFPLQKRGKPINPLRDLVDKMKTQVNGDRAFKNVYELTVYDPVRDAGPIRNRQCLSFLSFKVSDRPSRQVLLTAVYRNHFYIERLLGNLIGLGNLLRFVATETGLAVGPLTVISTHAQVEAAGPRADIEKMLTRCRRILNSPELHELTNTDPVHQEGI